MRKRAGLNQAQLAERSGATQTAISNYENGRRPLSLHRMRVFARLLDCTVADLLDPADNPYMLDDEERELVDRFRNADPLQREMVKRVAAPAAGEGVAKQAA
jgi:transcriptional regulator with XRE-family HTH domain